MFISPAKLPRSLTVPKINNALQRGELVYYWHAAQITPVRHARRKGIEFQVQHEDRSWHNANASQVFIIKPPKGLLGDQELLTHARSPRKNLEIFLLLLKKCSIHAQVQNTGTWMQTIQKAERWKLQGKSGVFLSTFTELQTSFDMQGVLQAPLQCAWRGEILETIGACLQASGFGYAVDAPLTQQWSCLKVHHQALPDT